MLCECVSGLVRLLEGQGLYNYFVANGTAFFCQSFYQDAQINPKQFRAVSQTLFTFKSWSNVVLSLCKSDISEIENCHHAVQHFSNLCLSKLHVAHALDHCLKFLSVINVRHFVTFRLIHVVIFLN